MLTAIDASIPLYNNNNTNMATSYYNIDEFLKTIRDPTQFIEVCDYQNSKGHLVFNTRPTDEIALELNEYMLELSEAIYGLTFQTCGTPLEIIWNMEKPLITAEFLFKLSENITLSCNIDFVDAISYKLFVKLFIPKNLYMFNYITILRNKNGNRLVFGIPDKSNMGALFRWTEKKFCKTYYGNSGEKLQYGEYEYCPSASTFNARCCIYTNVSYLTCSERRIEAIKKYENNTLRAIDMYDHKYFGQYKYSDIITKACPT